MACTFCTCTCSTSDGHMQVQCSNETLITTSKIIYMYIIHMPYLLDYKPGCLQSSWIWRYCKWGIYLRPVFINNTCVHAVGMGRHNFAWNIIAVATQSTQHLLSVRSNLSPAYKWGRCLFEEIQYAQEHWLGVLCVHIADAFSKHQLSIMLWHYTCACGW